MAIVIGADRVAARIAAACLAAACVCLTSCMPGAIRGADPAVAPAAGSTPPQNVLSKVTDTHRLRATAKLHAERDSEEGFQEASRYYARLAELEPDVVADRLNQAKTLLLGGELDACATAIDAARALYARSRGQAPPDLDYVSGLLEKRRRNYAVATRRFGSVTARLPKHIYGWFQHGYMQELTEQHEAALASFDRVLAIDPTHGPALFKRGMTLRQLGRNDEAKEVLARFKALPKSQPELEKCDLTAITLRPHPRAAVEPARAKLSWRNTAGEMLGEAPIAGVTRVRLIDVGTPALGMLFVGLSRLALLRTGGGRPTVIENAFGSNAAGDVVDGLPADLDNDGADEILLVKTRGVAVARLSKTGAYEVAPIELAEEGAAVVRDAALEAAIAVDIDHDGDVDIVAAGKLGGDATGPGACVLRNNADGTFTVQQPFGALELAAEGGVSIDAHDVDQANDLDVVFASRNGVETFLNRRDGTFDRVALPGLGKRSRVLVDDFDNDGAPDFFAAGGASGWARALNADRLGAPYQLRVGDPVTAEDPTATDACAADIDNDGDLDILLATAASVVVLRNTRGGTFERDLERAFDAPSAARTVDAVDLDGDGRLEIVVGDPGAGLTVFALDATPAYASLSLRPQGGKDNARATGTVVEIFAGQLYQNRLLRRTSGLHIGLGVTSIDDVDGLRLRWPQGIVQALPLPDLTEHLAERGGRRSAMFRQKEGLVASCPFLYAYGPNGWQFVTDVLGIAPLDEWLPPGAEPMLDPEEWVRIPGELLVERDGVLRIAVTEELRETAYLDAIELRVVEHSADHEVWTNESTKQPTYGPLELLVARRDEATPPQSLVTLEDGAERTSLVSTRDREYVHGYADAPSQWGGWVERYGLELTAATETTALLLTGRIAWYDSTVVYSLAQNGRTWGPLRLELVEPRGGERVLLEDLGVPAGMDRTMVAFLPDGAVPAGARLRLSGRHRFLWDHILCVRDIERVVVGDSDKRVKLASGDALRVKKLAPRSAQLGFHGYSRIVGDKSLHEQTYDWNAAAPDDWLAPTIGCATRYGDVEPLLREHDDRLVVLVSGDRVEIELAAPTPPRAGRRYTYFLRVSGWAKEAGYHNATGGSVEPLPLRAMKRYPPDAAEQRDDAAYREYLDEYQTRRVRRRAL